MQENMQGNMEQKCHPHHGHCCKQGRGGHSDALYGIGVIGALIYYIQHTTTFMGTLIGIGKAIFWPAVIVFKVLEMLKL